MRRWVFYVMVCWYNYVIEENQQDELFVEATDFADAVAQVSEKYKGNNVFIDNINTYRLNAEYNGIFVEDIPAMLKEVKRNFGV